MGCHQANGSDLTEKIIGCAFEVSNVLGCGFLEKVKEFTVRIEGQETTEIGTIIKQEAIPILPLWTL